MINAEIYGLEIFGYFLHFLPYSEPITTSVLLKPEHLKPVIFLKLFCLKQLNFRSIQHSNFSLWQLDILALPLKKSHKPEYCEITCPSFNPIPLLI